ncbi:MAG: MFS transporter [Leptolyngbya sp. SIO4C1]|nr:MFS transporter [Leptolyngbya sp. SIO4C1]
MTTYQVEITSTADRAVLEHTVPPVTPELLSVPAETASPSLRRSLKASTLDGSFSAIFENVVKGVLISNFLIELGAGAIEVGLIASIPMLAHLLQPLGAHFAEQVCSRHRYCLWAFGLSRLLWVGLIVGIFGVSGDYLTPQSLIWLTLGILLISFVLDALGAAAWLSWMAALVPPKLRGRYFGRRRSAAGLAALVAVPIGGWLIGRWPGGSLEGYGLVLAIGIVMGLVSLVCQFWMRDIDPQAQTAAQPLTHASAPGIWQDSNFLTLLLYLGSWTFALNLNAPFLNFYLLDSLQINVQWVTLYGTLLTGAYLGMMLLWGRLADCIGNRPVLAISSLLTAGIPILWVQTAANPLSLWLWLPLLHLLKGGTLAALDLCTANIQLELAPAHRQSAYFAIAAATIGVTGFLGTTVGSLLADSAGDLRLLFALSSCLSLVGILPLLFVKESRAQSIRQLLGAVPNGRRLVKAVR